MANAPEFDPNEPTVPLAKKRKPTEFDPNEPTVPLVSTSEALGRGVESGLTAGFGDELKGLYAAGARAEPPKKQEPSTLENIANLGTTRQSALLQTLEGAYNYWTGAPEAEKKYEETKAKEKQAFEEAKKQHPIATMIGEVGGSVPTTMLLPGGTAAAGKLGQRMLRGAQVGAEYGAIQGAGEGEGLEGRLTGAGVGALTGGVGGAAAPAVVTGVSKLVANPLQKILSVGKGWLSPEAEAAKRIASALAKDEADIVAGNARGMTRSDWVKARDAGDPVTIADLGASNTQALLRSAANTSPEARNILEKVIYERFEGQSERVSRDIRQLVSGGANRFKTADQLEAEYRVAAKPAYYEAYARPNAQSMWDQTIADLARAPVVQDAIKLATKEAENEAVRVGASPIRHPFKIDQNGNLSIADPNMKTNLAFWDIVKQNLDDKVSALYRSGEKNAGNRAKDIKNDFVSHLDDLVPAYKKARGVAADYFGASNALEAGSKAANTKVAPEEISKLMRSMIPEERDLFREGYASSWAEKILAVRDRRDVTGGILASPQERRMAGIVFGVDNIAKIETRIDLERIMDGARKALGNSTTARQLIEAGLAGGAGAGIGYEGGGGWGAAAGAFSGAAGARHQAGKAISKAVEHAAKYVDRGTARRVAEMLVSDDPNVLGEGLRIASRNRNIAEGLKSIADRLGVIAAEKASSGIQPRTIPQITIHKEPPRATGGSVFDKMHAAKHMQEGGGLSSFLEGEYSGNKEGQHGGGYLGIESPTGNAGIGGQGWRENTPEGPVGRASITNVDVGHKIGDLNLTGSFRANQREIARPSAGGNTYFDPIEHPGQKFRMPNDIDKRLMIGLSKQFSDGGSVFDKMHMARKRAEGGGTDVPFNEWDAVPRNAEGIPQIRIEKPPVNEADEAQAAREAAAARIAGNVRGAPYEPTPPSTEGKTWMMEPGKEAVQSGNYEMPPNVRLNDAGIPYNVETGEELQMARRPSVLPLTRTPDGVQWAVPKAVELAGDIVNPLAVTKGVALNPGEFALGSGPIKRAVLEQPNAPTFYSALDRAVSDIPQAKASAEQWAATLANRPGVKPEEIQWRGLDQYLAGRQGQTVTKQEIADHLAGNKVELGSVVKGGSIQEPKGKVFWTKPDGTQAQMHDEISITSPKSAYREDVVGGKAKWNDENGKPLTDAEAAKRAKEWETYWEIRDNKNGKYSPKFEGYQLPGGENYSEKLLTLPEKDTLTRHNVKVPEGWGDTAGGNVGVEVRGDNRRDFRSSHWDEPNPVTHMRTNERTIGNTASHHIEEVQSDWHQKGRTEGYADPAKRDIAARELLTAESELKKQSAGEINRNYKEAIDNQVEFHANPELDVGFAEQWFGETPEQQSAVLRYMAAKRAFSPLAGGVPDAPFKKTWPDLTMKQALRDAVENGKDRLSWTPGEAQAKRYDLSQHVKEIEYVKNSDGTYRVGIADKDGEPIRSLPGIDVNRMTMAQIEATVGKEIAVKIENGSGRRYRGHDGHTLEGLDLKVGGEGMNEFYNKMLPKAVEKLGKAYGVKVQRGVDTTGNPVNYVDIPPAWKQEILKKGFSLFAAGGSVFDKMHAAKHMAEGGGLESFIKSLGSQGAAFGTQTEQEQAGHQRDPISELGKGAYNAVEHLAKENIDNANLLATGNRDQFSGKPGFEAGMLTMGATPFGMTKGGVNIGHGPGFPLSFTERMEQGKQVAMNAYNRGKGGGSYGISAKGRTAPDAPKGSHDRFIQENKSRWDQDKKAALDAYRQAVNPQESQHLLAPGESYADFLNSFKKGGSVFDKMKRASK